MNSLKYCLGAVLLFGLGGCGDGGPALAPVKGKVTMYGKPYTKGIVTFEPKGGGPAGVSQTDANGDYEIWSTGKKGAVIGEHKISVTTILETPAAATPPTEMSSNDPAYEAQASGGSASQYTQAKTPKEPIPPKYNKNTELVFEVKSGSNEFNIDIK